MINLINPDDYEEVKHVFRQEIRKGNIEAINYLKDIFHAFPMIPDEEYFYLVVNYRKLLLNTINKNRTVDGYEYILRKDKFKIKRPKVKIGPHHLSTSYWTGFRSPLLNQTMIKDFFVYLTEKEIIAYLSYIENLSKYFSFRIADENYIMRHIFVTSDTSNRMAFSTVFVDNQVHRIYNMPELYMEVGKHIDFNNLLLDYYLENNSLIDTVINNMNYLIDNSIGTLHRDLYVFRFNADDDEEVEEQNNKFEYYQGYNSSGMKIGWDDLVKFVKG
jgi:hypothetical protein